MKFTFLLPAYKGAFLKDALRSIQAQTYEDFSVLVSDDCSPDPLFDIVEPFLSDPRFSYRRNDTNIGGELLVSHWNMLLSLCQSPYLIVASDDDLYEPSFLEEMDALISNYPRVTLFRGRLDKIDQDGRSLATEPPSKELESMPEFISNIFHGHLQAIGQYVFNTDVLQKTGGFKYFPLAWFSDNATAILSSTNGVAHSSSVLFHFRDSGLNISTTSDTPHTMRLKGEATLSFYKWFKTILKAAIHDPEELDRADRYCKEYCCDRLLDIHASLPLSLLSTAILTFPDFGIRLFKKKVRLLLK